MRKDHVTMSEKGTYISKNLLHQYLSLTFLLKNKSLLQLPASYSNEQTPWLTTLLLPWTISIVPNMWTLENAKTDLVDFLGRKMIPIACM